MIIKTTYPVEFWRAVNLFVVILGSKRARATIQETNTNKDENNNVIVVWKRCHPSQQTTSGNDCKTCLVPSSDVEQLTTWSKVYIIGRNKTVTKRGTTFAMKIKGNVKVNLFFEKEYAT